MKKQHGDNKVIILGAGITGLSAGYISGLPVYESTKNIGGICNSYYINKYSKKRLLRRPKDDESYRFEYGGGHWIFGGDHSVIRFKKSLAAFNTYARKASVYFNEDKLHVPYPIQNHLSKLDEKISRKAFREIMTDRISKKKTATFADWLLHSFGKTLYDLFFHPFNKTYTAELFNKIAPQDSYKSPINKEEVKKGFLGKSDSAGYNATFIYPKRGLDELMRKLGRGCDITLNKHAIKIDLKNKKVHFLDKSFVRYEKIISTIPLDKMIEMTSVKISETSHPSTSVLVLNIGAKKGADCPQDHWVYVPKSKAGFHRVGFYSNVDESFLPKSYRGGNDYVSIYVEKSYKRGTIPSKKEIDEFREKAIKELQDFKWISSVEVCDPTWIETAYTWSYPDSKWREEALNELERNGIYQVGRYGRWVFQGITDSVKDGLMAGAMFMDKKNRKRK